MFKNIFSKVILAGACLLPAVTSHSQIDLNQALPIDTSITIGKLSNGLTYYIRPNAKPAQKVELRLVINAGSLLENDGQRGLAHFLEHMEFNGLQHYPKNELVDNLQKMGVQFGADLNAMTTFDKTYYLLPIPTDKPGNLETGFQILSDWAGGALITTDEVNDERRVIMEELRMRDKNAGTRMMHKYLPVMLNHSRYADRLPIGLDSIIQFANPDRIREFYRDWYRPNLMAVIVVGDITKPRAKEMIEKYFGHLKNPANERPRTYYEVAPYTSQKAMVVTDPEASGYGFSLMYPARKIKREETIADFRNYLLRGLFLFAMNRRLGDLAANSNPPYTYAGVSIGGTIGSFTLNNENFQLDLAPIDNLELSIHTAIAELLKVQKFGFAEGEIQIQKNACLGFYENAYNERNANLSAIYTDWLADNFMKGARLPGIENEYRYVKELLPSITAADVNAVAKEWLSDNRYFFTMVTGTEKGKIVLPAETDLLAMVNKAFQQNVQQSTEKAVIASLLTNQPVSGRIISNVKDAQLGTTTYTLSNGVKVTIKPTTFKNDEIMFSGLKLGGAGQYGVADKFNISYASTVIENMGYGAFTPSALRDFLAGKNVNVSAGLSESSDVVYGTSSVKDLQTLMELNYLKLLFPRKDSGLFNGFVAKMAAQIPLLSADPQYAFQDSLTKVMYNNNPRAPGAMPGLRDIENMSADRMLSIYKEELGYADGFHFFIVGNIDEATIKPLLEKYIASLPVKGIKPMYKDNGVRRVSGNQTFKFYKGKDQKSMIVDLYHGETKYTEDKALKADMLAQAMTIQVNEVMREKMQAIYSGGVSASVSKFPYEHYSIYTQFPCGPENVDKIIAEFNKQIAGYKKNGVSATDLQKVKIAMLDKYREHIKQNGLWISKLQSIMFWGDSKDNFLNYEKRVNAVTTQDLKAIANEFLSGNNFKAISYPEKNQ